VRANNWCLDAEATDCAYLTVLWWIAQLVVNLALRDLTRTNFGKLPPVARLTPPMSTNRCLLRRMHAMIANVILLIFSE